MTEICIMGKRIETEDEGRVYYELSDGLRLIFQNGEYAGHFNPLLTTEG